MVLSQYVTQLGEQMSRLAAALQKADTIEAANVEEEVTLMIAAPDDVPADVWELIQENGRVATERLNELLTSPRFTRLKAGDQARLIALGQNRAYGMPKANNANKDNRRVSGGDVTAAELNNLVGRATLPEFQRVVTRATVIDAEVEYEN